MILLAKQSIKRQESFDAKKLAAYSKQKIETREEQLVFLRLTAALVCILIVLVNCGRYKRKLCVIDHKEKRQKIPELKKALDKLIDSTETIEQMKEIERNIKEKIRQELQIRQENIPDVFPHFPNLQSFLSIIEGDSQKGYTFMDSTQTPRAKKDLSSSLNKLVNHWFILAEQRDHSSSDLLKLVKLHNIKLIKASIKGKKYVLFFPLSGYHYTYHLQVMNRNPYFFETYEIL